MKLSQVTEHKGLTLKTQMLLEDGVVAVIGRNGAGKSRLLDAIFEGKIQVETGGPAIPRDQIIHLTTATLKPQVSFGFDPVKHRDNIRLAKNLYGQNREKFHPEPLQTISALGNIGGRMGAGINAHVLAYAAASASRATGKDVKELDEQDIADFFSSTAAMELGTLNVTATMLEYMERLEENEINQCRNERYEHHKNSLPTGGPEEFKSRFGPPPWEVLNGFLNSVFDGRYYVDPPKMGNTGGYEAHLRREDGQEIPPDFLSSGEKTLLWLSLCIYSAESRRFGRPPRLLLLDEPDATLHPQMIQKLHIALETMARQFDCNILFTTHSPTTIALFKGPIYRIAEGELVSVERDAAISELLVGVDQVSIEYSNRRQVYVESHKDAELYSMLFQALKRWEKAQSAHISLSFIAAARKLPVDIIKQTLKATLGTLDESGVNAFIEALNGQGNCVQVIGTVEDLVREGNNTVYGIVDWDTRNKTRDRIHVLGLDIFYSIENAILNPLTLGLYLLHNFSDKIDVTSYGVEESYDPVSLYMNGTQWQMIADAVTRRVLGVTDVQHDVECSFLQGATVKFDRRYVHQNGHDLEEMIRKNNPFLKQFTKRPTLTSDVVTRGILAWQGRSLPCAFQDVFGAIQLAR